MIMKAFFSLLLAAALFVTGCDDTSSKKTETKPSQPEVELETGRFALQKMLPSARLWAADAKPVRVESVNLTGSNGHDGKANFWRATFGSAARQKQETFTWSGVSNADTQRGVNHGAEDTYSPTNRSAQGFDLAFLKVDSDKAFEVAQEHGGKPLLAKNPKQEVVYLLDWDPRVNQLNWHVGYGGSESNARLSVTVNATEGRFVHKE
jgi:hypothetical protein